MPMINGIPEKITDFNVYDSGHDEERLIGVGGEMTLPTLEAMTETLSIAGVAGEIDSVTPGYFGPLELEVPFVLISQQALRLASGDFANLTIRGAMQSTDVASGTIRQSGIRLNVRGPVKTLALGTMGKAKPSESSVTLGPIYLRLSNEKNHTMLELDKLNNVYIVDGVDKLATLREFL